MLLLLLLTSIVSTVSAVRVPHLPLNGALTKREASINASDYPALTISIPVDHYNSSDNRTYENRYWINDTYYRPGGPVFYFDSGEQNAHPLVPYFLAEVAGPSSVMTMARRFNGLALIFEHRFYGDLTVGSYPFPMNSTTGMAEGGYDAYKYLNTEQALQDPVYFANNFQPPGLEQSWPMLSPNATPWVWLGGSYPGIRGAHMRVRNPETFYATWASSAPTQSMVDMWVYFAQDERSMTRNCSADYTAITNWVDATLTNGTAQEIYSLKYDLYKASASEPGSPQTEINSSTVSALQPSDVGNILLVPFDFYQYYGFERSVLPFCNIMETYNDTSASTTDNGGTDPAIASESGIFASTGNITLTWTAFLTALQTINYNNLISPTPNDPIQDMSWMWQYCSEYGYYQRGNVDRAAS